LCPHFRHPDGKSCSALESGLAGDFWPSTVRGGNSSLVEGRRRRRRVVTGEGSRSFCSSIVLAATHRKKRFVYPKLIPSPLVHKDSPPPTLVPLPSPLPRTLKRAPGKGVRRGRRIGDLLKISGRPFNASANGNLAHACRGGYMRGRFPPV